MENFFRFYALLLVPLHAIFALLRHTPFDIPFCEGIGWHGLVILVYYVLARLNGDADAGWSLQGEPSGYVGLE